MSCSIILEGNCLLRFFGEPGEFFLAWFNLRLSCTTHWPTFHGRQSQRTSCGLDELHWELSPLDLFFFWSFLCTCRILWYLLWLYVKTRATEDTSALLAMKFGHGYISGKKSLNNTPIWILETDCRSFGLYVNHYLLLTVVLFFATMNYWLTGCSGTELEDPYRAYGFASSCTFGFF